MGLSGCTPSPKRVNEKPSVQLVSNWNSKINIESGSGKTTLDRIAWNINEVIDKAKDFLNSHGYSITEEDWRASVNVSIPSKTNGHTGCTYVQIYFSQQSDKKGPAFVKFDSNFRIIDWGPRENRNSEDSK